mmetsp:Transcript_11434/g.29517  ORF Transcript_11434/g.29517 Transcript_11434/m.29517 type:complete len:236 (-) Transcript_11434:435-1142(-)
METVPASSTGAWAAANAGFATGPKATTNDAGTRCGCESVRAESTRPPNSEERTTKEGATVLGTPLRLAFSGRKLQMAAKEAPKPMTVARPSSAFERTNRAEEICSWLESTKATDKVACFPAPELDAASHRNTSTCWVPSTDKAKVPLLEQQTSRPVERSAGPASRARSSGELGGRLPRAACKCQSFSTEPGQAESNHSSLPTPPAASCTTPTLPARKLDLVHPSEMSTSKISGTA